MRLLHRAEPVETDSDQAGASAKATYSTRPPSEVDGDDEQNATILVVDPETGELTQVEGMYPRTASPSWRDNEDLTAKETRALLKSSIVEKSLFMTPQLLTHTQTVQEIFTPSKSVVTYDDGGLQDLTAEVTAIFGPSLEGSTMKTLDGATTVVHKRRSEADTSRGRGRENSQPGGPPIEVQW